jgi:hypothetical protein
MKNSLARNVIICVTSELNRENQSLLKKTKQLSSNLQVTGQWAVVVRCMMDNSGILKVYIIQTKKYAYRLQFRRAIAPN